MPMKWIRLEEVHHHVWYGALLLIFIISAVTFIHSFYIYLPSSHPIHKIFTLSYLKLRHCTKEVTSGIEAAGETKASASESDELLRWSLPRTFYTFSMWICAKWNLYSRLSIYYEIIVVLLIILLIFNSELISLKLTSITLTPLVQHEVERSEN